MDDKPSEPPDIKKFLDQLKERHQQEEKETVNTADPQATEIIPKPVTLEKPLSNQSHKGSDSSRENNLTSNDDSENSFGWVPIMALLFVIGFFIGLAVFAYNTKNTQVQEYARVDMVQMEIEKSPVPGVAKKVQEAESVQPVSEVQASATQGVPSAEAIKKPEDSPSVDGSHCDFPIKPNDGSWSLSKGKCFTVDNSKDEVKNQPFAIGGETAIVSVTGGDFIVITADAARSECYSGQSIDNCMEWMREHLSRDREGRHWFLFILPEGQKISINTARE